MSICDDVLSKKWLDGYARLAKDISSSLPSAQELSIVELGCGSGQLTIPLAKISGQKIIGVDSSKKDLEKLQSESKNLELDNIDIIRSKADKTPIEDSSVDCAISNFFVGWLDRAEFEAISLKTWKLLKDGGIAMHCDFSPEPLNQAQKIVVEQGRKENNTNPSVRWWRPEEVSEVMIESGFNECSTSYFDWGVKLGYSLAVEELRRWDATTEFISKRETDIQKYGLEFPKSFITRGVK